MSTAQPTLDIPTLEGALVAKHRRPSFNEEIALRDLEKDCPTPTKEDSVVSTSKTAQPELQLSRAKERVFLAVLCWGSVVLGWNDGTLGPLLPRIQETYHLGYATVSMLFVCATIGCIIGSMGLVWFDEKLGFGKMVSLTAALQMAVFVILAVPPPFPVMCILFVVLGFARAIQGATAQAFVSCIPRNSSTNMGILHAAYGLGAFVAPLVSTQFSQLKRWYFHYLISTGISVGVLAMTLVVFRFRRQEDLIPSDPSSDKTKVATKSTYKQLFTQKFVLALSAFILIYVGIEVAIGGWIVTFLINKRGGGPSAGYVSSGFFGGLMLGRLLLLPVNQKARRKFRLKACTFQTLLSYQVGKQRVIYVYSALVIVLQFTVWFVPSLIENAIAVSFVGLFLGPIYPVSINVAAGILPAWLLVGAIGFIGAFGQAGGAVFPFMTGAIASKFGVQVLQPVMLALMFAQLALWYFAMHSKVLRTE
ncbi:hypothetical protein FRB90_012799 [Tulasnella sp. 427]|nr:hypothetical protein FRB90_012799 [Tulasnella sp. 427]